MAGTDEPPDHPEYQQPDHEIAQVEVVLHPLEAGLGGAWADECVHRNRLARQHDFAVEDVGDAVDVHDALLATRMARRERAHHAADAERLRLLARERGLGTMREGKIGDVRRARRRSAQRVRNAIE